MRLSRLQEHSWVLPLAEQTTLPTRDPYAPHQQRDMEPPMPAATLHVLFEGEAIIGDASALPLTFLFPLPHAPVDHRHSVVRGLRVRPRGGV